MEIHLEEHDDGRWIATQPGRPGCWGGGRNTSAAIAELRSAIVSYDDVFGRPSAVAPATAPPVTFYDAEAERIEVEPAPRVRLVHWLRDDNGSFSDHVLDLVADLARDLAAALLAAADEVAPPPVTIDDELVTSS